MSLIIRLLLRFQRSLGRAHTLAWMSIGLDLEKLPSLACALNSAQPLRYLPSPKLPEAWVMNPLPRPVRFGRTRRRLPSSPRGLGSRYGDWRIWDYRLGPSEVRGWVRLLTNRHAGFHARHCIDSQNCLVNRIHDTCTQGSFSNTRSGEAV